MLCALQVMRNFHLLMCSLAIYDFLYLVLNIACFSISHHSEEYSKMVLRAIPYMIPLAQVIILLLIMFRRYQIVRYTT